MVLNGTDCVPPALNTLTSTCYDVCKTSCMVYSTQGASASCNNHPVGMCHANVGANNCVVLCFDQPNTAWTYLIGVPDLNQPNIGLIERIHGLNLPNSVTSLKFAPRDHIDNPDKTIVLTAQSIENADNLRTLSVEQLLIPNISALTVYPKITTLELRQVKLTVEKLNEIVHVGSFQNLDLSYNELKTIPGNVFGMSALQTLNMTGNKLAELVLDQTQVSFLRRLKSFQGSSSVPRECSKDSFLTSWSGLNYCFANKTSDTTAQPEMIEESTTRPSPSSSSHSNTSGSSINSYLLYIGLGGVAVVGLIFYFVIFRKKSSSKARKRKPTLGEQPDEASYVNSMPAMDNNVVAFQACQSTRSSDPPSLGKSSSSRSSLASMPIRSLHNEILPKDIDISLTSVVFRHNHFDMLVGRMRQGKVYVNRLLPMTHDKALSLLSILSTLRHPRIMNVVGVIWRSVDESPLGGIQMDVCLEYLDAGTLEMVLNATRNQLTWSNGKMQMALEIALALMQVHEHDFVYQGLTGKTVFVDGVQGCKLHTLALVDESPIDDDQINTEDRIFLAPEVLAGCAISSATDMYAFGVLLMLMDAASTPRELSRRTWMQTINDPDSDATMPDEVDITGLIGMYAFDESHCPAIIKAVAKSCLHPDPYQRPSASFAYAMMHKDLVE